MRTSTESTPRCSSTVRHDDVATIVSLRPGVDPVSASRVLADAAREANNVLGTGGTPIDLFNGYLAWAVAQERLIAGSFPEREVERLLTTRRYWTIQNMDPAAYGASLTSFITLELNSRIATFDAERAALGADLAVWNVPSMPGTFAEHLHAVVVDTNVLMRHRGNMTELDWPTIAGTHPTQSIAVTIPETVVAELDNLKHSNAKMTFDGVAHDRRWLATLALGWLDRTFPDVERRALIREAATSEIGPVTQLYAVLLSDPLGHVSLPKPDSEIIDNALRLSPLAKSVTLASYDSHMIFTARHLGLRAFHLPETTDPSPT